MSNQPVAPEPKPRLDSSLGRLTEPLALGIGTYYFSTLIVVLGVVVGHTLLPLARHPLARRGELLGGFASWDGQWYTTIVERGYSYHPDVPSPVAFFPAYPLLSLVIGRFFGLPTVVALLLVSHLCLAAAFVVLAAYLRERCRDGPPSLAEFTLLAFGLFPTTMFFRMAYSESLFVLVLALFLYGTQRRWPLLLIALLVGLGTACRAPGLGLLPPLVLHVWQQSASLRQRAIRLCLLAPLASWGLAAWMLYQGLAFGEPLAFVKTQAHWRLHPPAPAADKWADLLSFGPIRTVYDSTSPGYWATLEPRMPALFSLQFANPLYFLFAAVVTTLGWLKGWLRPCEAVLAASLLVVPYVASGYEIYMSGAARFAAVVLPVYFVLGHLLWRLPRVLSVSLLALSSFLLGAYAALFASWHRFV